jgi:hypothetical protein
MEAGTDTMDQKPLQGTARSPRIHVDSQPLPTDSMVTVPLSETATDGGNATEDDEPTLRTPQKPEITIEQRRFSSRPTSAEILQAIREPRDSDASIDTPEMNSPTLSVPEEVSGRPRLATRSRSSSNASDRSAHVDWAELEKKEEQESHEDGQDEVYSPLSIRNQDPHC